MVQEFRFMHFLAAPIMISSLLAYFTKPNILYAQVCNQARIFINNCVINCFNIMSILFPAAPIEKLQIASDGCWENALHILKELPEQSSLNQWLVSATEDVAVEAFIPVDNGVAFIGVRLSGIPSVQQHALIRALVHEFNQPHDMIAATFVKQFELSMTGNLFQGLPTSLELGKVNAWRSFGSMMFWHKENPTAALKKFKSGLLDNPRFTEASELPYAIEFQYAGKLPHWYALPISRIHDGIHNLDGDLAAQAIIISSV